MGVGTVPRYGAMLVLLFFTSVIAIGCSGSSDLPMPRVPAERSAAETEMALKLARKHNAIVDWDSGLGDDEELWLLQPVHSVQVQQALTAANRPVLLRAGLEDVFTDEGQLFARFAVSFKPERFLYAVLTCTPEQAERLLADNTQTFDKFAAVAVIDRVHKGSFYLDTYVYGKDEVELEPTWSESFLAYGRLVEAALLSEPAE